MGKLIQIKDYDPNKGIQLSWEYGHSIECKKINSTFIIKANEAGLISLANHLLTLAQPGIPSGYHLHLDDSNGLEDSSCELIIERK
jgi:hypothetical protein